MGAENGSNNPSSTVLDGLYGVQLGRPSDPAQTDGGASSSPAACEHHHKRGRGGTAQAQQRLQIRRLWQHRPSCFKPIHCTITCTVTTCHAYNLGLPVVIKAYYSICFEQVTSMLARLSRTSSPRCPSSFLDCRLQGNIYALFACVLTARGVY
uniref:Uncharacterized protein n=1 Tax=Zea mays TaxID=4577 RepID=C0P365_MAIZE|nr:unknown [Zea mays]